MNIEIGKEFKLIYDEEKPENYIIDDLMFFILPLITVLVMLSVLINSINRRETLLSNENYVSKAPASVVEKDREILLKEKFDLEQITNKLL